MKTGWVYLALAVGAESFVKIGFTAACPWARIAEVTVGCPLPLRLVGVIRGTMALERELQGRFIGLWTKGEWFRWSGPLIEFVNTLPAPSRKAFHRAALLTLPRSLSSCVDCRAQYDNYIRNKNHIAMKG